MDITSYLVHIANNIDDENIICDDIFVRFVKTVETQQVKISALYFYQTNIVGECFTFDGFQELLDGIISLSGGRYSGFVEKLETRLEMHYMVNPFSNL